MPRLRRSLSIQRVWTRSTTALIIAAVAAAIAMRVHMLQIVRALDADTRRIGALRIAIDGRLTAMLNQEVGLRGFLATGDPGFLRPYLGGRRDEAALRSLSSDVSPEDRVEIEQAFGLEVGAARRWQQEIAEPQIAARRGDRAVDLSAFLRAGKVRFDAFRAAHGTLDHALARVFGNDERRRRDELRHANVVAAGMLAMIIFVVGGISRSLLRQTVAPLVALAQAAERGEVSVEVVRSSRLREVLTLAETLERLFRAVQDRAMRDGLTRVYNRGFLAEWLPRQLRLARRSGAPLSALMVDVDHFKRINDSYGHAAGDQVLVALARCLERELRASDVAVRYGGEEFTVLLPDTPLAGGLVTAERLRAAVAGLTERDGLPAGVQITVSIGLADLVGGGDGSHLVQRADAALYLAKRGGRNRVVTAAPPSPGGAAVGAPDADEAARLAG